MSNAPRYRLVGYDIGTAPDENGGWVHWTDHEAIVARLTAERDDATRAKDCFQRMTRAHWEALCAMRNSINEYIPMPNTDSGPLFSPEDGPIYADIAERVIADLTESRAYALAQFFAGKMSKKPERIWSRPDYNECWHKRLEEEDVEYVRADLYAAQAAEIARLTAERDYDRKQSEHKSSVIDKLNAAIASAAIQPDPEASQAALAKAAIAALRDIDDIVANSEGVSGLHLNGDMAPWSEIMDGGAYGAWLQSVERLREAIRALTPPADLAAQIGGE